jgi:hypothetical protein
VSARSWQDTLADQIAANGKRAGRRSVAVNYPTGLYAVVRDAAKRRGMSMTAYQRRASLAFAVHDLGLDASWAALMVEEPAVTGYVTGADKPLDCAGFGPFGAWRITGLGLFAR